MTLSAFFPLKNVVRNKCADRRALIAAGYSRFSAAIDAIAKRLLITPGPTFAEALATLSSASHCSFDACSYIINASLDWSSWAIFCSITTVNWII